MHRLSPYAAFIMRLAVGGVFLAHGWAKYQRGLPATAAYLHDLGFPFATVAAVLLMAIETVGAACVVLGVLTRLWATAMAVEMGVVIFAIQLPDHGNIEREALLLAGAVALIALGDGPLSLAVGFKRGK